jgi:hypothetical protein
MFAYTGAISAYTSDHLLNVVVNTQRVIAPTPVTHSVIQPDRPMLRPTSPER